MIDTNSAQPSGARAAALDQVVPLLKAALDPASKRAERPGDSPAGRIVSQVARSDAAAGGTEGLVNLATSLTFTLSYMLPAMAQAQARQPEDVLAQLVGELRASGGNPDVVRVVEQLDSLTGSAAVLAEIMGTDQVAFLDLVLELADFTAQASVLAARVLDCPLEEVWEEVDAGLRT